MRETGSSQMDQIQISRISIQVSLSGYSFKIETPNEVRRSLWLSADKIFSTPEFQVKYDSVEISLFTPKCSLVPSAFFSNENSRELLSQVADLSPEDNVSSIEVPQFGAVMIYSDSIGESLSRAIAGTVLRKDGQKASVYPELFNLLGSLSASKEYNKILASYRDGCLYLVIAQGNNLKLCNSYSAADFTTAEYFLFLAIKKLQLNPEVSTVCFNTPLTADEEMSLYRYFNSVQQL